MKRLSYWAKNHKWAARLAIVGSYIILNVLAYYWGMQLFKNSIIISPLAVMLIAVIFLAVASLYPDRKTKDKYGSKFYLYQKTCDLILVFSSVLLMISLVNRLSTSKLVDSAMASYIVFPEKPKDSVAKKYLTIQAFNNSMKDSTGKLLSWRLRKMQLKQQLHNINDDTDLPAGVKALLVILSIAAALGLMYLVAGLACNLSCSGAEGLAAVVLFGGGFAVIFLTVVVIKAIVHPKIPAVRKSRQPA